MFAAKRTRTHSLQPLPIPILSETKRADQPEVSTFVVLPDSRTSSQELISHDELIARTDTPWQWIHEHQEYNNVLQFLPLLPPSGEKRRHHCSSDTVESGKWRSVPEAMQISPRRSCLIYKEVQAPTVQSFKSQRKTKPHSIKDPTRITICGTWTPSSNVARLEKRRILN